MSKKTHFVVPPTADRPWLAKRPIATGTKLSVANLCPHIDVTWGVSGIRLRKHEDNANRFLQVDIRAGHSVTVEPISEDIAVVGDQRTEDLFFSISESRQAGDAARKRK